MRLFLSLIAVAMIGAGVMEVRAQDCSRKYNVVTIEAQLISHQSTRDLIFKLRDNRTFSSLMGTSESTWRLHRALKAAKTGDGRLLIPEKGTVDLGKSEGRFDLNEELSLARAQEVLEQVLKFELFPCGRSGAIRWKGDFDPKKRLQALAHKQE